MQNRFFIWLHHDAHPVAIVPKEYLPQLPITDYRYVVGILAHLDKLLPHEGLTFVLTWRLDDFHEVMNDAVILLHGDERYQKPWYNRRVKAVFKFSGVRPNPLGETLRLPASIAWRSLLRDSRNSLVRFGRLLKYGPLGKISIPLDDLPLGYFALLEMDPLPLEHRPIDVFFAGSLATRGWSIRASHTARQHMSAAMAAAQKALPQYRIESMWRPPKYDKGLGPAAYTEGLAKAKVALAPRGNTDETYRLFEAAKLGCVMICEPLPARWYYQNCPAITLRSWSELPHILKNLLHDPARMSELSRRSRAWWESTVSETAIAGFIARRLSSARVIRPKVSEAQAV